MPDAPNDLRQSMELDLYTLRTPPQGEPADAELVSGMLGEYSMFHHTFDYYGDGVSATTAVLPRGWLDRTLRVTNPNMGGGVAICLEPHDLAVSKLVAGREKDMAYIAAMLRHRVADAGLIQERLEQTDLSETVRRASEMRLRSAKAAAETQP